MCDIHLHVPVFMSHLRRRILLQLTRKTSHVACFIRRELRNQFLWSYLMTQNDRQSEFSVTVTAYLRTQIPLSFFFRTVLSVYFQRSLVDIRFCCLNKRLINVKYLSKHNSVRQIRKTFLFLDFRLSCCVPTVSYPIRLIICVIIIK